MTVVLASVALVIGGMIYILFRPTNLLMFDWIKRAGLMSYIYSLRQNYGEVPEWVAYSLPDGLWMFSYCLFIGCIWNFELKRCIVILMIIPVMAVIHEILQYFHVVSGTFDVVDLLAYIIGFTSGLLFITNKRLKI